MSAVSSFLLAGSAAVSGIGTYKQYSSAKKQGELQQQMIAEERKQEELRRRQMEIDARRRQMEILRQEQRTRAMSLAIATSQSAQGGSGLQGAFGQISGQTNTNLLGVNQSLSLGRDMFASNAALSDLKMGYAAAGTEAAFGRSLSNIGGSLFQLSGPLGRLLGGFGSFGGYGSNRMGYGQQVSWMNQGSIY